MVGAIILLGLLLAASAKALTPKTYGPQRHYPTFKLVSPTAVSAKPGKRIVSQRKNKQPTSKSITANSGRNYSSEEVQALIVEYSKQYGIAAGTPLCIAFRESGYNQFSKNKHSTASGVFQYLTTSWQGTDEAKAGASVFDAEMNVRAAIKDMAIHKSTRPWVAAKNCPPLSFQ